MNEDYMKIDKTPFIITGLSILGILAISSILAFIDSKVHPLGIIPPVDDKRSKPDINNDDDDYDDSYYCNDDEDYSYIKRDEFTSPHCCGTFEYGDLIVTEDGNVEPFNGTQEVYDIY